MSKKGGKKRGGRELGQKNRDPRALMRDLGLNPDSFLSPIEFLLSVMNADLNMLNSMVTPDDDGKVEMVYVPTMGQRIEAAKHAAPFLHQKLPSVVEQNVTHSWADQMREAEERLKTMRVREENDECENTSNQIH